MALKSKVRAARLISKRAMREGYAKYSSMTKLGLSRLPLTFPREVARSEIPELAKKFAIVHAFEGIALRDKGKRTRMAKLIAKMELPASNTPERMQEVTFEIAEELGPAVARRFVMTYKFLKHTFTRDALEELKKQ